MGIKGEMQKFLFDGDFWRNAGKSDISIALSIYLSSNTPPAHGSRQSAARLWVPVLAIAIALSVGFALLNAINEQAESSPVLLESMLLTTIPLLIMVIIGVYLVVGRGKRR